MQGTLPLHRSRNPKGLPASRSHTHAHLQPPSNPTQTSIIPALLRFIPSSHAQAHHPINRMAQGTKTPPPLNLPKAAFGPHFIGPAQSAGRKALPSPESLTTRSSHDHMGNRFGQKKRPKIGQSISIRRAGRGFLSEWCWGWKSLS